MLRIEENEYIGLQYAKAFKVQKLSPLSIEVQNDVGEETTAYIASIQERMADSDKFKYYLLSPSAMEIASKIKIVKDFDSKVLGKIKPQSACYLLGKDEFIRFVSTDNNIFAIHGWNGTEMTKHGWPKLEQNIIVVDYTTGPWRSINKGYDEKSITRVLQCIIFMEVTEPELMVVEGNSKKGNRALGTEVINRTTFCITRVTSSWNKFVVRATGFGVDGHLRLQPYGPGRSERKLIWIEAFQKHGYIRKPKT